MIISPEKDSTENQIRLKFVEVESDDFNSIDNKSNSKHTKPRRTGGDDIAHEDSQTTHGTFGCILRNTNDEFFIITNFHNILTSNTNLEDTIVSPAKNNRDKNNDAAIGTLFWYKYDTEHDMALIKVNDKEKIIIGTKCYALKDNLGKLPKDGQNVMFCGYESCEEGEIIASGSSKRLEKGGSVIIHNAFKVRMTAMGGDSGSVVINTHKEVVGLLFSNQGSKYCFFHDLRILLNEINSTTGKGVGNFNFKQFN